ncbi:hypothetical protein MO973_19540 [Paenibacillus sp. TRM 82003]|nr:hypothetical protein [Paenibacillus sp. TRM 82003]
MEPNPLPTTGTGGGGQGPVYGPTRPTQEQMGQLQQQKFWDKLNLDAAAFAQQQIAAQIKAFQDQQAQQLLIARQQEMENKRFLGENIDSIQKQNNVNDFRIAENENRFGGTYSGGLRLQQAANDRSSNEAIGAATRDVQSRNANIWAQYGQLAQQAQQKIADLSNQTPQLVQDYISRALQNASSVGSLTGQTPWGTPTYSAQQDQQAREWDQFTYWNDYEAEQAQNEASGKAAMAEAEAKQMQQQREYFTDLVNASDKLGYIVPELAQVIGVKPYSSTLSAKTQIDDAKYKMGMLDVSKRNASTNERNASTSASRENRLAEGGAAGPVNYKNDAGYQADYAFAMKNPEQAIIDFEANPSEWIALYGIDGFNALISAARKNVKKEDEEE